MESEARVDLKGHGTTDTGQVVSRRGAENGTQTDLVFVETDIYLEWQMGFQV
jgi:hypothetical protein